MLGHVFRRTLAATAAMGGVASLALVALVPSSASAAADCNTGYPGGATTTTGLSLSRSVGEYGDANRASVSVSSSGAGTPKGRVTVSVDGERASVNLSGGKGSVALPRDLAAGATYSVTARYAATSCYRASSASKFYTVKKVGVTLRGVDANDIRSGGHPKVTGRAVTDSGATPGGSVSVKLYHGGDLRKSETVSLHGGRFSATFSSTELRGAWTAVATLKANGNHGSDSASTGFRVR